MTPCFYFSAVNSNKKELYSETTKWSRWTDRPGFSCQMVEAAPVVKGRNAKLSQGSSTHLERQIHYSLLSRIFFGGNNNDCGSCCYNNGYSNGFNNGNNFNQGSYNQGSYNQGNYNQGSYSQGSFSSGGCQCDYSLTFQVVD